MLVLTILSLKVVISRRNLLNKEFQADTKLGMLLMNE